jgi:dTDP-glucose pyrophosphorylase/predicted transcriptional regulator
MGDDKYKQVLVQPAVTIREALKRMDKAALQVLVIVDDLNQILGIVTDGDVRRAVINNIDFNRPISSIMNTRPLTISAQAGKQRSFRFMQKYEIKHLPVINKNKQVIGLFLMNDFLKDNRDSRPSKTTPVVIMAGGKGARLDPFTRILPKPLIPINNKPIIEVVMDKFCSHGLNRFYVVVNYKAELIKMFFLENINEYTIEFVDEKECLGTAGGLSLVKDRLRETFILSNCDVITDANIDDFLDYHKSNNNAATILAILRYIKIPYGVLKTRDGNLEEIIEKPEQHFMISSGIYALEPEILQLIPQNEPVDMPNLLMLAKQQGLKVQVYPASASWFDIGEWGEYQRAIQLIDGMVPWAGVGDV